MKRNVEQLNQGDGEQRLHFSARAGRPRALFAALGLPNYHSEFM